MKLQRISCKPLGIRLQHSERDWKFYLCIDLTKDTTFSKRISRPEFLSWEKLIKTYIEEGLIEGG